MLTPDQARDLSDTFRLLGEPNRLTLVVSCLNGPLGVGTLVDRTGLNQSLVSHHLRLLRAARLLKATRQGKNVSYAIADGHVRGMLVNMIEHLTEPHPADETGATEP